MVTFGYIAADLADKDTLYRGIPMLAAEEAEFIERAFVKLDVDCSNAIDWPEFINLMSAMEKGNREKQAIFLFKVRVCVRAWLVLLLTARSVSAPLDYHTLDAARTTLCLAARAVVPRCGQVYDEDDDDVVNEDEFRRMYIGGLGVADDDYIEEVRRLYVVCSACRAWARACLSISVFVSVPVFVFFYVYRAHCPCRCRQLWAVFTKACVSALVQVSSYFVRRLFTEIEGEGATTLTLPALLRYLAENPQVCDAMPSDFDVCVGRVQCSCARCGCGCASVAVLLRLCLWPWRLVRAHPPLLRVCFD